MGIFERRIEIIQALYKRGYETISNLANEFDVSERTILRDVSEISRKEPIYTQSGRYGGGIYLMEGLNIKKKNMSVDDVGLLKEIRKIAQLKDRLVLNENSLVRLDRIIEWCSIT